MDASGALREIGIAVLILLQRNRLRSVQRLRSFRLNICERLRCPLPFQTRFCTFESIAVRPRINDEQEVTLFYAVSFPIRDLIHVACHPGSHFHEIDGCNTAIKFVGQANWLGDDSGNLHNHWRGRLRARLLLTSRESERDCQNHDVADGEHKMPRRNPTCATVQSYNKEQAKSEAVADAEQSSSESREPAEE
jgi:hypothetical protein